MLHEPIAPTAKLACSEQTVRPTPGVMPQGRVSELRARHMRSAQAGDERFMSGAYRNLLSTVFGGQNSK